MFIKYWVLHWVPILLAFMVVGIFSYTLPNVVLWVFWLNALWVPYASSLMGALGKLVLGPFLPTGVWEAVAAMFASIHAAYVALMSALHALTVRLPPEYGARTEVLVRGYLVEGWLLILEVAYVIRLLIIKKLQGLSL